MGRGEDLQGPARSDWLRCLFVARRLVVVAYNQTERSQAPPPEDLFPRGLEFLLPVLRKSSLILALRCIPSMLVSFYGLCSPCDSSGASRPGN